MWDLIVSVPDHCLSFYLGTRMPYKIFVSFSYFIHTIECLGIEITSPNSYYWIIPSVLQMRSLRNLMERIAIIFADLTGVLKLQYMVLK